MCTWAIVGHGQGDACWRAIALLRSRFNTTVSPHGERPVSHLLFVGQVNRSACCRLHCEGASVAMVLTRVSLVRLAR